MPRLLAFVAAGALAASAMGCGSGSDSGGAITSGSCDVAPYHACIEWSPTSAGNVQTACSYTHGTYTVNQCTPTSRIGRCAVDYGSYVMTVSYYPGAGTEAELQKSCNESSGPGGVTATWSSG
jgi:hypothetical protein